tara:strand:- start:2463 stop:4703 length:2241 start_codon:yes stop_codon:yes gene_type:complete
MEQLKNITKDGVPESRLNDPKEVQTMVLNLIRSDDTRSKTRSKVKGLVDGNPPYSASELKKAGRSFQTNVNFREAEGFLNMALSAFYDVFSESQHYASVTCNHGTENQREEYGRIMTEEFDRLQKTDGDFDYMMQLSQHEMVLYGTGPVVFEDAFDWRCKPVRCGNFLVPDETKSNSGDFTVVAIRNSYPVHELYSFIRNEETAKAAGWDVGAAREAIMKAAPSHRGRKGSSWEYYQQQIRSNDLSYSAKCDTVDVSHVFYREFPSDENPKGSISHCIIDERGKGDKFLFRKVNRYENWSQCVHVMFYDKGDGRYHGVKGMGIKFYSALELKNRLRNSLVDSAVARSSIVISPNNPNAMNRMNIINMGAWTIMPPDFDVKQTGMAGALEGPLAVERELEGGLQANLSQYRQRLEKQGNPRTATEIEAITAQQSVLGKTQLNRYYAQLDELFAERYRRASSSKVTTDVPGGAEALEFQNRCLERGVPMEALRGAKSVRAARTVGRGSPMERRAVMNSMLELSSMLPEGGREKVIKDAIASMTGWHSLERYFPAPEKDVHAQEQQQEAARENILFRHGTATPVSDLDNHAVHSQVHLEGAEQAMGAAMQGEVDPMEVMGFLSAALAHTEGHVALMQQDSSRREVAEEMAERLAMLSQAQQQLAKQLAKQREQQQQQAEQQQAEQQAMEQDMAAMQNGMDPKDQLAQMRAQREEERRDAKLQNDLERRTMKTHQDMALKDAKTAQKLSK